jgi:hypothetical protein
MRRERPLPRQSSGAGRLTPLASPDEMPIIGYSLGALTGGVIEVDG